MSLRVPGPTPCPENVLQAMSRQMINHRGKEFGELMERNTARLKELFQTRSDVFMLTSSGTGGMEAAVVNTLSPGDKVLSLSNGVFGDRFATIAEQFGANVTRVKFEWGKAVDPDAADKALKADPGIKAVLVTHNETSTAVTSDLKAVSSVVRKYDKLLLVDAISSLGCIDLQVDNWGCDVVITASQKGWMVPPGMAFISFNQRAWQAHKVAKMPRFYWDIASAHDYLQKKQTPWTPAVSLVYALDIALPMMLKEGLPNIFARHARLGKRTREGAKALGLMLFVVDEKYASNTVTAINVPPGIDGKKITDTLRDEHDIVLSGGQSTLAGKIFRIGHLGFCSEADIDEIMRGLKDVLPKLGYKLPHK